MEFVKVILVSIGGIALSVLVYVGSRYMIDDINEKYIPENPYEIRESTDSQMSDENMYPQDVDRMISHGMDGTGEEALPIQSSGNYTIYTKNLYVSSNQGKTWMLVPDDTELGYARISDYLDDISENNFYISGEKVAVVYGGKGSENISIIKTIDQGTYWSVASISRTATHDLNNGYDALYIDFPDNGKRGYILAIRSVEGKEEKIIFSSVDSGVSWIKESSEDIKGEVLEHFGKQELSND
ncbi:MAG: hypothetical protein ACOWWR_08260 [Eubacteriales bacterium]